MMNVRPPFFYRHKYILMGIVLLLYTLVPFLMVMPSNMPSADDFKMAYVYSNSDFFYLQKETYMHWSGRYTATALLWLNPLLQKSFIRYQLFACVNLFAFGIAIFIFIFSLLRNTMPNDRRFLIASLTIATCLFYMPSIAEGIYWFAGYAVYNIAAILILLLVSIGFYVIQKRKDLQNKLWLFVAIVLCFVIIGCNEMALIIVTSTIAFSNLVLWLQYKKVNKLALLILVCCITFSLISILAPGNFVRMEGAHKATNRTFAFIGASGFTMMSIIKWSLPVIVLGILSVYFITVSNSFKMLSFLKLIPIKLYFLWMFATMYVCYFANMWSTGSQIPGRADNIIFMFFVITGSISIIVVALYNEAFLQNYTKAIQRIALYSVFAFIAISCSSSQNTNIALVDYATHYAKNYKQQLMQREKHFQNSKGDSIIKVEALKNIPKTIYVRDLADSLETEYIWINEAVAWYYKTPKIQLTTLHEPPKELQKQLKDWWMKK